MRLNQGELPLDFFGFGVSRERVSWALPTAVFLKDLFSRGSGFWFSSVGSDFFSSGGVGGSMVNDGGRIIEADTASRFGLFIHTHQMRFGESIEGDIREFRNPAADESSGRILVSGLFCRRVNPDRVDPGSPGLHLHLAKVDSRFEIEKEFPEEDRRAAPVEP